MEPISPKPFLKWAGGKGQLLKEFRRFYPAAVSSRRLKVYYEPFIGGGAVLFDIARLSGFEHAVIGDSNPDLVSLYKHIRNDLDYLIDGLGELSARFFECDETKRRDLYYEIREAFNNNGIGGVTRSTYMLFLNRTCYNGLFRVNKSGLFNVPFGRYKRPRILDQDNLRAVSQVLACVDIRQGDFEEILAGAGGDRCFVYLDPPYRPLNKTSRFNSYAKGGFTDCDQSRLADTLKNLSRLGCSVMLSNSNPLNADPFDYYLHRLYEGFTIREIYANRMINSAPGRRGRVSELLVTNYE